MARENAVVRLLVRIGPAPWAGTVMRLFMVPLDIALQRRSAGRHHVGRLLGVRMPTLLLTTTGARSGLPRVVPLFFVPHGGGYAVVGSNFGQPHHPAWSANLLKHPVATVAIGARRHRVSARLLEGAEREDAWGALTGRFPGYQEFSDRSRRTARIFALEPLP
ncbi:nitroreductase family deazaflavin-dependent oxidoreductase [Streptomyces olivoreticuli]